MRPGLDRKDSGQDPARQMTTANRVFRGSLATTSTMTSRDGPGATAVLHSSP